MSIFTVDEVVSIEIWNKETEQTSGVGRAVAGGLMFGPLGAVVGAATKKDKQTITFKITRQSGAVSFVDAKIGDKVYKKHIAAMKRLETPKVPPRKLGKAEKVVVKVLLVVLCVLLAAIIIPFIFM